ncbi:MAG: disulfide bond formation protein B [Burkholderiales bacterium]|nr:disulfide bond formation protein B [Burkholderiales bacterium]
MLFCRRYSPHKVFYLIAAISGLSLLYSFYAEFYLKFEPCPLCIVQRIIIIAIMVFAILFALHNSHKNLIIRLYAIIIAALALFNIKTAAHHAWLMNLPPEQQPLSCGMPLNILYQRVPLPTFLNTILEGDAECSKITWTVLGAPPPYAVIILCSIITFFALIIIIRGSR